MSKTDKQTKEVNVDAAANAIKVILNQYRSLQRAQEVLDALVVAKQLAGELDRRAEALNAEIAAAELRREEALAAAAKAVSDAERVERDLRSHHADVVNSLHAEHNAVIANLSGEREELEMAAKAAADHLDRRRQALAGEIAALVAERDGIRGEIEALKARFQ